jgi:hypothetical protein
VLRVEVRLSGRGAAEPRCRTSSRSSWGDGGYAFDDWSGRARALEQNRHGRTAGHASDPDGMEQGPDRGLSTRQRI